MKNITELLHKRTDIIYAYARIPQQASIESVKEEVEKEAILNLLEQEEQ